MAQQGVKFVRIRGRIVPIREKGERKNVGKGTAVAAVGAGVAGDAARTTRVYQNVKTGVTLDRKKFTIQPFVNRIGDTLIAKKGGKVAGQVRYYTKFDEAKGRGGISWIHTRTPFRGQGLSKVMGKQASIELRAKGVRTTFDHVVHPNSAKMGSGAAKTRYWKEGRAYAGGYYNYQPVDKKTALKHVNLWHGHTQKIKKMAKAERWLGSHSPIWGKLEEKFPRVAAKLDPAIDLIVEKVDRTKIGHTNYGTIFRETRLPTNLRRSFKPFRTFGNKAQIAGGLAMLGAGAYLAMRRSKPRPQPSYRFSAAG